MRWEIYAKAGKWEMAAEVGRGISVAWPENSWGFIHYAYALHELKRTKEAWGILIPIADKFPDEFRISYNLACYSCQLGNLKESKQWLEKAIAVAGKKEIRLMALEDDDLKPLWKNIGQI
jgi:predicted Zn-dependent protease